MVRSWRAVRALTWRDRGLFLRAWLLLLVVAPGLRVFGFQRTQGALGVAEAPGGCRRGLDEAQAIARIVHAAANRNPLRPSCLARSIVLVHQLRRRGLAAEIRIGVAKPDGRLAAHAWVEHDGVALAETDASRDAYAPLDATVPAR